MSRCSQRTSSTALAQPSSRPRSSWMHKARRSHRCPKEPNVSFVVEGSNGQQIVFKDRAVLAKVRQPLLCVGKLFRGGWYPRPSADGNAAMFMFMCKGSQEFPIHFSRNSLAASMRILRTEELPIRSVVEVPDSLLSELRRSGWQVTTGSTPTHVQMHFEYNCGPQPAL